MSAGDCEVCDSDVKFNGDVYICCACDAEFTSMPQGIKGGDPEEECVRCGETHNTDFGEDGVCGACLELIHIRSESLH